MYGHWYVVANQKLVRIFTEDFDRRSLRFVKSLVNPLGQEKRSDLVKKLAGHAVKSAGACGQMHYTLAKRHDPHEQAVIQFAKTIGDFLEKEKQQNAFESLTIVAEPHFLGKIRAALTPRQKKLVTDWLGKDLQKIPEMKLPEFLLRKEKYPA